MAGWSEFAENAWIPEGGTDRGALWLDAAYNAACKQVAIPGETEFVGKTVRWYYAKDVPGELVYALSGNKVPRSDGAKPMMVFDNDNQVPSDVDHDWYINEAVRMLRDIGALPAEAA